MNAFENQNLDIFDKGDFQELNHEFINETRQALQTLSNIQERYQKMDNDTFLNEFRDSMVANYLGFDLVNTEKHGFDAKKSLQENVFLEVKQVSLSSQTWQAVFNDTNEEKAQAFMDEKTFLAVGIWHGLSELQCIVYGQNSEIGEYLFEKVQEVQEAEEYRRSTQTISVKRLVCEYGFRILPVPSNNPARRDDVIQLFRLKFGGQDWWADAIQ